MSPFSDRWHEKMVEAADFAKVHSHDDSKKNPVDIPHILKKVRPKHGCAGQIRQERIETLNKSEILCTSTYQILKDT